LDQEHAERQLLELLRGQDAAEFTLRVEAKAGRWYVSLSDPSVKGDPAQGEGDTFWEAWHDTKPHWAT
jgi:hypothetical protein